MTDKGWRSKGGTLPRRSPRKRGNKCRRPFTAPKTVTPATRNPRKKPVVTEIEDSEVQVVTESEVQKIVTAVKTTEYISDSEVHVVTETENERHIVSRQETLPQTINVGTESDTTGRTPDICRSPLREVAEIVVEEGQATTTDVVGDQRIQSSQKSVKVRHTRG
jgi:hypothetical protein